MSTKFKFDLMYTSISLKSMKLYVTNFVKRNYIARMKQVFFVFSLIEHIVQIISALTFTHYRKFMGKQDYIL